ncbi:ATP-grasp domain-containing protein [Streptomyces sp. TRM70350]|uniref:ATP-grasp domain-containing protein n=1 Tax=Streptomyces sp. TRM70350 TaxID=2856165 RepID=UPI001C443294|nr:ATP-grasp domain-containing protein [Streptomyces sp. TRM70350]MBV7696590.1 ATP-grasp domain-containing protein [Streptomyces sp. TRM70350]
MTSTRRRVAVVGGHSHSVMSALDLDLDVVLVHAPGMYEEMLHDYCERIVHAELSDAGSLLEAIRPLHEERPFERVLTTSEAGAVPTAVVVEQLGLPGNSVSAVRALYDKVLTREALARAGVSPVRYQVVDSARSLTSFLRAVGGRIVVKPVDGTASADVHILDDEAAAADAWEQLAAAGYRRALAEEYLDGPVISVEAFSAEGRHLPVALMTSVLDEHLVEMEHSIPGAYGSEWTDELHRQTVALLTEVGLWEGPTHTEFILTADGPRMLESHSRMGGGGTPSILRRAYGLDFSRLFLSVPLGIEKLPERAPEPVGAGHIRFFAPEPGVITGFDGIERLTESGVVVRQAPVGAKLPGVPGLVELSGADTGVMLQMNVGDTVPAIRAGWDRAMGYVIATGKDTADAARRCAEVDEILRFRTMPAPRTGDGA